MAGLFFSEREEAMEEGSAPENAILVAPGTRTVFWSQHALVRGEGQSSYGRAFGSRNRTLTARLRCLEPCKVVFLLAGCIP